MIRPTRVEIDLEAIAGNVALACKLAGPRTAVMAVVKADAYGHGAVPVARAALASGATRLAVAIPEEAIPLRAAGIHCPILVLGPIHGEQAELTVSHRLDQCVSDFSQAEPLDRAARAIGGSVPVHLKVDTGMGRVGVTPKEAPRLAAAIRGLSTLRLAGIMTHFAEADAADPSFTREQLGRFGEAIDLLRASGIPVPARHVANSAALLGCPEARLDLVRPGIMLYGCDPRVGWRPADPALRPALSFRTRISQLKDLSAGRSVSYGRTFVAPRDMRIATLPVGYADGLARALSNRGQALVRGQRVPIVGRICMDMTMVDVTGVAGVRAGDEVVLIGRQDSEAITAEEIAGVQGTISYEVLCQISGRVPRVYLPIGSPAS